MAIIKENLLFFIENQSLADFVINDGVLTTPIVTVKNEKEAGECINNNIYIIPKSAHILDEYGNFSYLLTMFNNNSVVQNYITFKMSREFYYFCKDKNININSIPLNRAKYEDITNIFFSFYSGEKNINLFIFNNIQKFVKSIFVDGVEVKISSIEDLKNLIKISSNKSNKGLNFENDILNIEYINSKNTNRINTLRDAYEHGRMLKSKTISNSNIIKRENTYKKLIKKLNGFLALYGLKERHKIISKIINKFPLYKNNINDLKEWNFIPENEKENIKKMLISLYNRKVNSFKGIYNEDMFANEIAGIIIPENNPCVEIAEYIKNKYNLNVIISKDNNVPLNIKKLQSNRFNRENALLKKTQTEFSKQYELI